MEISTTDLTKIIISDFRRMGEEKVCITGGGKEVKSFIVKIKK